MHIIEGRVSSNLKLPGMKTGASKKCNFISFDKFNNVFKVRRKDLPNGGKNFKTFAAAHGYVKNHFGDSAVGRVQNATRNLKSMSYIYGYTTPLFLADLNEAVSRHICDADVFQDRSAQRY